MTKDYFENTNMNITINDCATNKLPRFKKEYVDTDYHLHSVTVNYNKLSAEEKLDISRFLFDSNIKHYHVETCSYRNKIPYGIRIYHFHSESEAAFFALRWSD